LTDGPRRRTDRPTCRAQNSTRPPWDSDIYPWTYSPGHSPSRTIPLSFHMVSPSSTTTIQQSTIQSDLPLTCTKLIAVRVSFLKKNPRLMGWLGSGPHVVGRLGSRVWVSASLQIFGLTTWGNVLGGEGNCPAGDMSGGRTCLNVLYSRQ